MSTSRARYSWKKCDETMKRQHFEDFEKNAVLNFEEIEKNHIKNFEETGIYSIFAMLE